MEIARRGDTGAQHGTIKLPAPFVDRTTVIERPQLAGRLERLDDLRALAAGLVLLCHVELMRWVSARATSEWTAVGRFGVAIFFVISGLVIYRPFIVARRTGIRRDLWAYCVHRVTRIVPAYWFALTFFVLVIPRDLGALNPGLWGFTQVYRANTEQGLLPAWSLCIEMTFYLAIPLFAAASARRERWEPYLLVGLWLGSVTVWAAQPRAIVCHTLVGYLGWFALGMGLACLSCSTKRLPVRTPLCWLIAALGFVLFAMHRALPGADAGLQDNLALGLLATLVVLPALRPGRARARWLGERSYGIYLWHYPVLVWLVHQQVPFPAYLGADAAVAITAAHFSYIYIERPLMRRAKSFMGPQASTAQPPHRFKEAS